MAKVIDDIRIRSGKSFLKKEIQGLPDRKPRVCNFGNAKSIGLLCRVRAEVDIKRMIKFAKFLKGEFGTRKVMILGYFDEKLEPEYLMAKLEFNFITKKDLTWNGIPKKGETENFVSEHFDLLIDLTDSFCIPLRYVLLHSKAGFKVGRHNEEDLPYLDMLLLSKFDDFENFANDLLTYVNLMNPSLP